MSNKKCTACSADKQNVTMISMSEANWERHENRHASEKRTLFLIALIAIVLFFLSNTAWLIYETAFASRYSASKTETNINEVVKHEAQTLEPI